MRKPCSNCPWRIDAAAGHWDPQHFRDIWRNCQDDGSYMMLCHKAGAAPAHTSGLVCQGWVRVMGFDAIGVRLAVMQGTVTVDEVEDREAPPLYRSFSAMMKANGIRPGSRNKVVQQAPSARRLARKR